MSDDFKLDAFGEQIDKIFTDDWYAKITNLVNYVINIPSVRKNIKDLDSCAKCIIDYNIQRELEENILIPYEKKLPRRFEWYGKPITSCFLEFKKLIDFLEMAGYINSFEIVIKTDINMIDEFEVWSAIVFNEYRNLLTSFYKLDEKSYMLHVSRREDQ